MVNRIGLATAALLLALTSALCARAEFHMGSGDNAYAWERFTGAPIDNTKSQSDQDPVVGPDDGGEYVIVGTDGNELRRSPVTAVEEVGGGTFLVEYNYRGPDRPSMEGNALQAPWVDPLVNLARFDRLIARGGSIYDGHNNTTLPHDALVSTIDGDPTTSRPMIFTFNPLELVPNTGEVFSGNMASPLIVNLGTEMPINRIRIFPRLGRQDDAISIAAMEEPKPDPERFGETSFADNYLEWFEIGVTDNDAPIRELPGNRPTQRPGQGQFKNYSRATGFIDSSDTDPNFEALIRTRENLDPIIDFRFPVHQARWVSIRPYLPERTWEIAEFEIYGEGYVRRSVYRTHILDFGEPGVAWSKIRWKGKQPAGTQIRVRTRTGNTPSPDKFLERSITGKFLPVDFEDYRTEFVVAPDQVKRTVDTDNWSFWSAVYDFTSGERDVEAPTTATWTDGTPLLSPGPSRYLQLEIVLLATHDQTPRLDELSLLFSEVPAAEEVIGEIWPIEVDSFEPHLFTYVVKPTLREGNGGFDRLEIFTGGPVDPENEIHSVRVGGEGIDLIGQFRPQKTLNDDGIIISFDPLRDPQQDNEKRIEVEFSGWVYDSSEPDLRQSVNPGNATVRFVGDVLTVRTPTGGDLLQRLEIRPRAFTPNGDEINDEVAISFDIRDLTQARPVEMQIWTLDGRRVRQLAPAVTASGHFTRQWDGRDDAGRLAPPGVYLAQVELESDEGRKRATGIVRVAY